MNKGLLAFKDLTKGHYLGQGEYEVLCDLVEKELQKPQELYNKIKEKRDNAKLELDNTKPIGRYMELKGQYMELKDQINAYNDVLSLMESMFEVEENVKED